MNTIFWPFQLKYNKHELKQDSNSIKYLKHVSWQIKMVVPWKILRTTFLLCGKGGAQNLFLMIVSVLEQGGRGVNFQFPLWERYGCFLEWPNAPSAHTCFYFFKCYECKSSRLFCVMVSNKLWQKINVK